MPGLNTLGLDSEHLQSHQHSISSCECRVTTHRVTHRFTSRLIACVVLLFLFIGIAFLGRWPLGSMHASERLQPIPAASIGSAARRLQLCGQKRGHEDCPLDYSLTLVNLSAAEHDLFNTSFSMGLVSRRINASMACRANVSKQGARKQVTSTGGWCLTSSKKDTLLRLPNGQSYVIPFHHVRADSSILRGLIELVDESENVTINDFGCGVGQYGHELLAVRPHARWTGYDGAGNVEVFTNGFVKFFDLTMPLAVPKSDWLMSLEVGEHVPHQFEHMVIRNLHAHNCIGVILSWAILGQKGHSHVNMHGNAYIRDIFHQLGYASDQAFESKLRECRGDVCHPWFRYSVMVFRRFTPAC